MSFGIKLSPLVLTYRANGDSLNHSMFDREVLTTELHSSWAG